MSDDLKERLSDRQRLKYHPYWIKQLCAEAKGRIEELERDRDAALSTMDRANNRAETAERQRDEARRDLRLLKDTVNMHAQDRDTAIQALEETARILSIPTEGEYEDKLTALGSVVGKALKSLGK